MPPNKLGRALAMGIVVIAAFHTLASLSMPIRDRRPNTALVVVWLLVLLVHAFLYWFGDRARARAGLTGYVIAQTVLVFFMGVTLGVSPVAVGLYVALTTETIILAGDRWGVVPTTIGAIIVFAVNAIIVSDLYRGATAGLLLAVTGIVAWAGMRLTAEQRTSIDTATGVADSLPVRPPELFAPGLTPRELEVLRAVASGARSARIASDLGIAERTVKAHLASIYQKLGVESRAAAVAVAMQRGLASPDRREG